MGAMYHDDGTEHWMSTKQARYGARVAVLVLGLISVVVVGLGASFVMEKKGLNLRMGTDARGGTLEARMLKSKGKDKDKNKDEESDNDGDKPAPMPVTKPTKPAKPGRKPGKPTPAPISTPTEAPISTPTVPTAAPVVVPTAAPVVVPTAAPVVVPTAAPVPLPTAAPGCQMQQYTLADVAQNAASSKCWVSLYGVVYNLTSFVGNHPGGSVILSLCGTNGTATFNGVHGVSLLTTKGFSTSIIGRLGSTSGTITVPCNEVSKVSVTTVRRE